MADTHTTIGGVMDNEPGTTNRIAGAIDELKWKEIGIELRQTHS